MEFDLGKALLLLGVGAVAGVLNILARRRLPADPARAHLSGPARPRGQRHQPRGPLLPEHRGREQLPPGWPAAPEAGPDVHPSAVLGSLLGARLAVTMSDDLFKQILAGVMMLVVALMVVDPSRRWRLEPPRHHPGPGGGHRGQLLRRWGFTGASSRPGVGFLIISSLLIHGLDLVRINAIKVTVVLFYHGQLAGGFRGPRQGALGAGDRPGPGQQPGRAGWGRAWPSRAGMVSSARWSWWPWWAWR